MLLYLETQKVAPITLLIHTDGGSGEFALKNVIDALQSPVDGMVIGKACSMGSVILQMCRVRKMLPYSKIYCHYPTVTITFKVRDGQMFESDSAYLHQNALRSHEHQKKLFMERTKKSSEEVDALFRRGEIYGISYDADQSIELGLADEIVKDFKIYPPEFKGFTPVST